MVLDLAKFGATKVVILKPNTGHKSFPFSYQIVNGVTKPVATQDIPSTDQTSGALPDVDPSSSSRGPSGSKRRKSHHFIPVGQLASLTPRVDAIVQRCLVQPSSSGSSSGTPLDSPPKSRNGGRKKVSHSSFAWPTIQPYSRARDLTNDRSINPSPREIARAAKAEIDRAKAREESAALARAAAAAKRRKGKSRRGSKNPPSAKPTRSISPKDRVEATGTETPAQEEFKDMPASSPLVQVTSPVTLSPTTLTGTLGSAKPVLPPPPRVGLKRTRSIGLGVSTSTANTLGGNMAVGSPLRAVTGPNSPSEDDASRGIKRSRVESNIPMGLGMRRSRSRQTSQSPNFETIDLPPLPLSGGDSKTLPRTLTRRSSTNNVPTEGVSMRRTASAQLFPSLTEVSGDGGAKAMARTASVGTIGALGLEPGIAGRERVKREVMLPGRLRDYEMKAGTTV